MLRLGVLKKQLARCSRLVTYYLTQRHANKDETNNKTPIAPIAPLSGSALLQRNININHARTVVFLYDLVGLLDFGQSVHYNIIIILYL